MAQVQLKQKAPDLERKDAEPLWEQAGTEMFQSQEQQPSSVTSSQSRVYLCLAKPAA